MQHPGFIKPYYDARGFAGIPQMVKGFLNSEALRYDVVVLFLLDGFGWRFFEKFQDMPFLKRLGKEGEVRQLTAQFPSTTAAQVTCIHTGLPVGESGILEWYYYEPQLDEVIAPLLFSHAGTTERDTLKPTGIDPRSLYPTGTLYQELRRGGVTSYVFQHQDYTPSTFSEIVFDRAVTQPYGTLSEALVNLGDVLRQQVTPTYACLYYDKIDAVCHEYGPNSPQVEAEIQSMLVNMEKLFTPKYNGKPTTNGRQKKTLFMLTADHGQAETDPMTTIYLNRDPRFAGLERFIKANRKGEMIVPGGSARDMFLYIKEGLTDEARDFLAKQLEDKADVLKVKTLIEQGYFGPIISPKFLGRAGDLVILPYRYESVWWYEKDKFEQKFYGHHGGLTKEEMEIPLILYDLSD